MKLLLFTTVTTLLIGCAKFNKSVTIIKDCTGTYLQLNGKDYHVCNTEKTDNLANGTKVNATFTKVNNCNDNSNCNIVHENEGWIKIKKIK